MKKSLAKKKRVAYKMNKFLERVNLQNWLKNLTKLTQEKRENKINLQQIQNK